MVRDTILLHSSMEVFEQMEKKKILLSVAKVAAFLILALLLLYHFEIRLANGTDNHKYLFRSFYSASADEVDVVYIGASSASWNWNPTVAYHENGVASQLLSSERHPADALPYLLKEASLKHPKLYIIDVDRFLGKLTDDFSAVQSVIINMRPSKNRLDAADDMLQNYSDEQKLLKYSPFYFFHSRWDQLDKRDFQPVDYDFMGFSMRALKGDKTPIGREQFEAAGIVSPSEEQIENLNEFLRVCKQLDGDVIFNIVPFCGNYAGKLNFICNAVTSAGFVCINAADYLDEIGLEPGDQESTVHLSVYGAEKYTRWLSAYLAEKYNLPDRRKETGFHEGELYEQSYERYREYLISHGVMLNQYLQSISGDRYSILLAIADEASKNLTEENVENLRNLGFVKTPENDYRASYIGVVDRGTLLLEEKTPAESTEACQASGKLADGPSFTIYSAGFLAGNQACIIINGVNYSISKRGINIVVYDNQTHRVIDSVVFDTFDEKQGVSRGIPRHAETAVKSSSVSSPKVEGTAPSAKGIVSFSDALRINYDKRQKADFISLSLDADDSYNIFLFRNDSITAFYTIPSISNSKELLRCEQISMPKGTSFDSVLIVPVQGNTSYHLGHFIAENSIV